MSGIHYRNKVGGRNLCDNEFGGSHSDTPAMITCETCKALLAAGFTVPSFERVSHFDIDDVADEFGVNLKENQVNLNPPRRVRAALYLSSTFATPTVLWASSTGRIDDALTVLLGSYIAIVSGLAAANTTADTN